MKTESIFQKSVLAASIAMLAACSGSGSGTASNPDDTTVGVITGFGSIYINGVEYETDTASINDDGVSSQETSLGVGDVCVLHGSVNSDGTTGTATAVSCSDELEGYVLDVSGLGLDGTGSINVMGQAVTISADTVFESDSLVSINDLVANDIVEVSGFADGIGNVVATRIETKNAAEDVEVKGLVATLDSVAKTFNIGSLTVDYNLASEIPANLDNGLYVEVKTNQALAAGPTMIASKVEIEDDGDMDIDGDEGDEIEVQGMVSDVTLTSFRFNGSLVEFASLEIDEDSDITLIDGMIITVEGYIDANGNFVVEEIEEDHASDWETEGTVVAKTDSTVTINTGLESITFLINNDTRMIDSQDEDDILPLHYFSLADVYIGDYVEVDYYVDDASGANIATELEREDMPTPSATTSI